MNFSTIIISWLGIIGTVFYLNFFTFAGDSGVIYVIFFFFSLIPFFLTLTYFAYTKKIKILQNFFCYLTYHQADYRKEDYSIEVICELCDKKFITPTEEAYRY